jgi:hypothetical protein
VQVEAQAKLVSRAESELQQLTDDKRQLAARATAAAVLEEDLRSRAAELQRREAEVAAEGAR